MKSSATGILEIFFIGFLFSQWYIPVRPIPTGCFGGQDYFKQDFGQTNAFLAVWNGTQRRKTSANVRKKHAHLKRSGVLNVNLVHCILICCVKDMHKIPHFDRRLRGNTISEVHFHYIHRSKLFFNFSLLVHLSVTVRGVLLYFCRSPVYPVHNSVSLDRTSVSLDGTPYFHRIGNAPAISHKETVFFRIDKL